MIFFLKDGKLDVCIEVCDGLFTKIFARQKAKEYGVPVVMNSSDRGTTDIERFDLNPDLPILHGLIDHLDLSQLIKAQTNEEKVPFLLPMLGVDSSSNRLKASMVEIQETITTWPQLASGVVFGGGICTDVCRRILLGDLKKSGRYFVDIEDAINDNVEDYVTKRKTVTKEVNDIEETSLSDYQTLIDRYENENPNLMSGIILTKDDVSELVSYAVMAPSGGNIQPWKWIYKHGKLFLFSDLNRTETVLNFNNNANLIAFGAATENLMLKAADLGFSVELKKMPYSTTEVLIGVYYFNNTTVVEPKNELVDFIPLRATNRSLIKGDNLSESDLIKLKNSIQDIKGAELRIFQGKDQISQIQSVLVELDRIYLTSKSGHHHFVNEIRWDETENQTRKDGVDLETIDLSPTEKAGLIVTKKWDVVDYIKKWNLGKSFGKLTQKAIGSCSALGMIILPKELEHRFFEGGKALERVWLTAAQNNIGIQPVSISSFLFERITQKDFTGIEELEPEIKKLANQFYTICNLKETDQNVFFLRMLNGHEPSVRSLRRDIDKVLIYEK